MGPGAAAISAGELARLRLLIPEGFDLDPAGRGLGLTLRRAGEGPALMTLELAPGNGRTWPEGLAALLEDLAGSIAAAREGLSGSPESPEDRVLKLSVEVVERVLARHAASASLRIRTKIHTARPRDWF